MTTITRRGFVQSVLATSAALEYAPTTWAAIPQQKATTIDPAALVDPELLPTIQALPKSVLNAETLAADRKHEPFPLLPAPAPKAVVRPIPGPKGAPDLSVVTFDPAPGSKNRPAILYIHGGGYVSGTAIFFGSVLQTLAQDTGCLVVSVEYRLAPETKFPGALEDNYAALRWLHTNADSFGVDRARIAVAGVSAGGGHAAALAIAARDRKEFPIAFQHLIYPMLDDRTGSTRPVPPHIGTFVWTAQKNVFGWTALLGVPAGSAKVPAGAVPSRAEDLSGLPPTYIGVGSLDLFVEEDIDYARRLINAGVPTELQVVPGAYHGFDLIVPDATVTKRFNASMVAAIRSRLRVGA